ncbi:unnamed protein product [Heligmosomoides polygyrus]|uniref:Rho-GAP domain-containing protein n=1 Tax=Heligmosomoides polygyrus TaxID=6339 RepID=A0A183G2H2_HELPZ|nr:unnamed protein product [Heligmosomoides polygyrus]
MDTSFPLFSLPTRHLVGEEAYSTRSRQDQTRTLNNFPPTLINTLARLFTHYLSKCEVPSQWNLALRQVVCEEPAELSCCTRRETCTTLATIARSACCP